MKFRLIIFLLTLISFNQSASANEVKNDISFYTGTFDVIDKEGDDQTSLLGIEHQNPELFRDTFLGKFKPITGGFITGDSSVYLYTGVEGQYGIGPIKILPSFSPGYYEKGDGKDLGHLVEFKSEVQLSLDLSPNTEFGFSYNHISNASLGEKNPGANSYMFNFLKSF